MVRARLIASAFAALALLAGCGDDGGDATGSVRVVDAYAPATPNPVGVVYLTIVNDGDTDVTLVGAHIDGVRETVVHTTPFHTVGGQQPAGEVEVPAGTTRSLSPEGAHLMLIGVDGGLVVGDELHVELDFDGADDLTVVAPVVEDGTTP